MPAEDCSGSDWVAAEDRVPASLRLWRVASFLRARPGLSLSEREVAWECGFATPRQLQRLFRRYVGVTPHRFRRLAREGPFAAAVSSARLERGGGRLRLTEPAPPPESARLPPRRRARAGRGG